MEEVIHAMYSLHDFNPNIYLGEINEDRMKSILDLLSKKTNLKIIPDNFTNKNSTTAKDSRSFGYVCMTAQPKQSLDQALEHYTKSIAYSPLGSQTLGIAYGARSYLFFKVNLFHDCILDIKRALENNFPNSEKPKLYLRMAMCIEAIDSNNKREKKDALDEAEKWLRKLEPKKQKLMEDKLKKIVSKKVDKPILFRKNWTTIVPKLITENSTILGLSDAVDLSYSKKFGRHIVASRDIKPGELLFAQKPYVQIVLDNMKFKICWHCGEQTWSSVPCNNCTCVIYCSEKCRDEAKIKHHDLECKIISSIIALRYTETQLILEIRIAFMAFKEAGNSIENLKQILQNVDTEKNPLKKGFTGDVLDPTKFSSIYGMIKPLDPNEYIPRINIFIRGLITSYLLATKSDILGQRMIKDLTILKNDKNFCFLFKFMVQIASLVETHLILVGRSYNGSSDKLPIFATVTSPFSFLNHSCHLTVTLSNCGENTILHSLNTIKKGDQIFISYGPNFWSNDKNERASFIFENHEFVCDCVACTENWPKRSIRHIKTNVNAELLEKHGQFLNNWFFEFKVDDSLLKREKRSLKSQNDLPDMIRVIEHFNSKYEKNHVNMMDAMLILEAYINFHGQQHLILDHFRISSF